MPTLSKEKKTEVTNLSLHLNQIKEQVKAKKEGSKVKINEKR